MKNIKVLGSGCSNCKTTVRLIDEVAKECGVEIQLEKVERSGISLATVFYQPQVLSSMVWLCTQAVFLPKIK